MQFVDCGSLHEPQASSLRGGSRGGAFSPAPSPRGLKPAAHRLRGGPRGGALSPAAGPRGLKPAAHKTRGAALIVCIFAMVIVSSMVVLALDVATTEMSITRNTLDLSKALYVADAGIQHALAMLRSDRTWRDGFPSPGVEFPAGWGSGYVVTVADGAGGEVIVTATGTAGSLSKTIRATITVAP